MIRLVLVFLLLSTPATAHDWLEDYYDSQGRPCCYSTEKNGKPPDCRMTTAVPMGAGWLVRDQWEDRAWPVTDEEVKPSEDGEWWLCRFAMEEPPRCFFGPDAGV